MESPAERAVLDHALEQGYLSPEQVAAAREHAAAQPGALLPLLRGLIPRRQFTELDEWHRPDVQVIKTWLESEPQLDPLRGRAGWEELLESFQR